MTISRLMSVLYELNAPFTFAAHQRRVSRDSASRDIARLPRNVRDDLNWPPRIAMPDGKRPKRN